MMHAMERTGATPVMPLLKSAPTSRRLSWECIAMAEAPDLNSRRRIGGNYIETVSVVRFSLELAPIDGDTLRAIRLQTLLELAPTNRR